MSRTSRFAERAAAESRAHELALLNLATSFAAAFRSSGDRAPSPATKQATGPTTTRTARSCPGGHRAVRDTTSTNPK